MSMMNKMQSTDISPKTALLSIIGFLAVSGVAITFIVRMVSGTPAETVNRPSLRPAAQISAITRGKAQAKPLAADAYNIIVARNLFNSGAPKVVASTTQPPLVIETKTPPPTTPVAPFTPVVVTPTMPKPARPKLAYTGLVEIAGQSYALLENLELGLAQYTRAGSTVFGCTLVAISPREVMLEQEGETFALRYGDDKPDPAPEAPKKEEAKPAPEGAAATPNAEAPQQRPEGANSERPRPSRRFSREG